MIENNSHFDSTELLSVDDLLQSLLDKIDSDFLHTETLEFINQFQLSQNIKSSSNLFFDLNHLDQNKDINEYLRIVNENMLNQSKKYFLGLVKTIEDIKKSSVFIKTPILKYLYIAHLFIFKRFLPKVFIFKKIPFIKSLRICSQAEIMGRLHYSGFRILQFEKLENNNLHFFLVTRDAEPKKEKIQEGLFIYLNRIGKDGKLFKVFKIRTMHPYSEFIHQYLIQNNGFDGKGKIKNDFRTSGWGKFLRRTWIDELPQLINVLKGDMKIFGIRPVSESYFNTLDQAYKKERIKFKPGCIPPYLVLSENSSKNEVLNSEKEYMKKCIENETFWLDLKYTFISVYNILFKGRRSL
ncbi:MAG: sugar transferase [Bacteroidetes bacterium]|nr:sugar transferase [Bacteroidota bacterium]